MGIARKLSPLVALLLLVTGCSGDGKAPAKPAKPSAYGVEPPSTRCEGTLGPVEVDGDLVVPRDRTCRLNGTAVAGRVSVSNGASLIASSAHFGEGVSAHSFKRVVLRGGRVEGRSENWHYEKAEESAIIDFVFDGGKHLTVRSGPSYGSYYVLDMAGKVEIRGLYLDLGILFCARNERLPDVRGIGAETPGVLQGQCARGARAFGETDF